MPIKYLKIYHIIAATVFMGLGFTVIFIFENLRQLSGWEKNVFGILLVFYGAFRGYKAYRLHQDSLVENEDEI